MELHTEIIKELPKYVPIAKMIKDIGLQQQLDQLSSIGFYRLADNNDIISKIGNVLQRSYANDPHNLAKAIIVAYYTSKYGPLDASDVALAMEQYGKILVSMIETSRSDKLTSVVDSFYCHYNIWTNKINVEGDEIEFDRLISIITGYLYAISTNASSTISKTEFHILDQYDGVINRNKLYCIEGLLIRYPMITQCNIIKDRLWNDIDTEYAREPGHIFIIMIAVLRYHLLPIVKKIASKNLLFYEIDTPLMLEQFSTDKLTPKKMLDYAKDMELVIIDEDMELMNLNKQLNHMVNMIYVMYESVIVNKSRYGCEKMMAIQ